MAERLDSAKLGGFQSQLEVSCVSKDTEELLYNKTVCGWQYIYIYIYMFQFWFRFQSLMACQPLLTNPSRLGGAGLGRTSVCHAWSVRGSDQVCSCSADSRSRLALTGILERQGVVSPGFYHPWRGYVHRLAPEQPLFRGMPTGPDAFLGMPGVSRLPHCARTNLKKSLVPYSSGLWDGRQIQTTSKQSGTYALLSRRPWAGIHFGQPRFVGVQIWSTESWFQWQWV